MELFPLFVTSKCLKCCTIFIFEQTLADYHWDQTITHQNPKPVYLRVVYLQHFLVPSSSIECMAFFPLFLYHTYFIFPWELIF